LIAAVAAGHFVQDRFNDHRFEGFDPTIEWLTDNAPGGHRIGLTGLWDDASAPVYGAFGPRLANEVEYVGEFVRELLLPYPDRRSFVAATRSGDYDYVIVGLGRPPQGEADRERWVRAAGYEPIVRSHSLALYGESGEQAAADAPAPARG
jgi:hypothetical protein